MTWNTESILSLSMVRRKKYLDHCHNRKRFTIKSRRPSNRHRVCVTKGISRHHSVNVCVGKRPQQDGLVAMVAKDAGREGKSCRRRVITAEEEEEEEEVKGRRHCGWLSEEKHSDSSEEAGRASHTHLAHTEPPRNDTSKMSSIKHSNTSKHRTVSSTMTPLLKGSMSPSEVEAVHSCCGMVKGGTSDLAKPRQVQNEARVRCRSRNEVGDLGPEITIIGGKDHGMEKSALGPSITVIDDYCCWSEDIGPPVSLLMAEDLQKCGGKDLKRCQSQLDEEEEVEKGREMVDSIKDCRWSEDIGPPISLLMAENLKSCGGKVEEKEEEGEEGKRESRASRGGWGTQTGLVKGKVKHYVLDLSVEREAAAGGERKEGDKKFWRAFKNSLTRRRHSRRNKSNFSLKQQKPSAASSQVTVEAELHSQAEPTAAESVASLQQRANPQSSEAHEEDRISLQDIEIDIEEEEEEAGGNDISRPATAPNIKHRSSEPCHHSHSTSPPSPPPHRRSLPPQTTRPRPRARNVQVRVHRRPRKIIVVGDMSSGKSQLISAYASDRFSSVYTPTILRCHRTDASVCGEDIELVVIDISGRDDFEPLRRCAYRKMDAALVCYAVDSAPCFERVRDFWVPELRRCAPKAPFLLVGLKRDIRDSARDELEERLRQAAKKGRVGGGHEGEVKGHGGEVKGQEGEVKGQEGEVKGPVVGTRDGAASGGSESGLAAAAKGGESSSDVGAKSDCFDNTMAARLRAEVSFSERYVSADRGKRMAQAVGATGFMECSSLYRDKTRDVFETATMVALRKGRRRRKVSDRHLDTMCSIL